MMRAKESIGNSLLCFLSPRAFTRDMDLASAHTNAKALILSLRDGVERLEKAEAVSSSSETESEREHG